MVYFWTYAHPTHPLYCPSDLQARGFNSCGRTRCTVGRMGTLKAAYWCIRPTLSRRLDIVGLMGQFFVGQMGIFRRSDEHFSQVGWAFFVGRMGTFRRLDGCFSYRSYMGTFRIGRLAFFVSRPRHVASARPRNELNLI